MAFAFKPSGGRTKASPGILPGSPVPGAKASSGAAVGPSGGTRSGAGRSCPARLRRRAARRAVSNCRAVASGGSTAAPAEIMPRPTTIVSPVARATNRAVALSGDDCSRGRSDGQLDLEARLAEAGLPGEPLAPHCLLTGLAGLIDGPPELGKFGRIGRCGQGRYLLALVGLGSRVLGDRTLADLPRHGRQPLLDQPDPRVEVRNRGVQRGAAQEQLDPPGPQFTQLTARASVQSGLSPADVAGGVAGGARWAAASAAWTSRSRAEASRNWVS